MKRLLPILAFLALLCGSSSRASLIATFNTANDIPVTASGYTASGAFSASLNFAPATGTTLTVVKNTGATFINGTFANLAHGQTIVLSYNGVDYPFVANYYGGSGNDLVLQWGRTRLVAWGGNGSGQLGDQTTINRWIPVNVYSLGVLANRTVFSAAAGPGISPSHSLAVCADGSVLAWGNNMHGQLGTGGGDSSVPALVNSAGVLDGKKIISAAIGGYFSVALSSDGKVFAWGANNAGQLGDGSTTPRPLPVAVNSSGVLLGKTVVGIAAGYTHSLALSSDGTVASWGAGPLGHSVTTSSPVPIAVDTTGVLAGKFVTTIASGVFHSLALCSDGTVVAWGSNNGGALGRGWGPDSKVPVAVDMTGILAGKTVVALAAGDSSSMALCSDGTLAVWGTNYTGQLGNGTTTSSPVPIAVDTTGVLAGKTVTGIATGTLTDLAYCSDGTIAAWGYAVHGELGNNSITQSEVPVAVSSAPLAAGEVYVGVFGGPFSDHSFSLIASPPAPVVETLPASHLSGTGARLNGTVNAAGGSAAVFFDYGLDTAYGTSIAGNPASVSGATATAVNADLTGLLPNTIYHYRVRAANAGGTTNGADLTFTTPSTPFGGTMALSPASPVDAGATLTVSFADWTDVSLPLSYAVLVDNALVSLQGASATRNFIGPIVAGAHVLKGRIYNAEGYYLEVTQNFTVNTAQESWRVLHFGTAQNAGHAADLADPDGDGANNRFEYVAGLVPTSAVSLFAVRATPVDGQPTQRAIIFGPLVAGRTYVVKYKTSLTDTAWTTLTDIFTSDSGTERTVIDLSTGTGGRFYTVEITK